LLVCQSSESSASGIVTPSALVSSTVPFNQSNVPAPTLQASSLLRFPQRSSVPLSSQPVNTEIKAAELLPQLPSCPNSSSRRCEGPMLSQRSSGLQQSQDSTESDRASVSHIRKDFGPLTVVKYFRLLHQCTVAYCLSDALIGSGVCSVRVLLLPFLRCILPSVHVFVLVRALHDHVLSITTCTIRLHMYI
jgi:hypothetical protein